MKIICTNQEKEMIIENCCIKQFGKENKECKWESFHDNYKICEDCFKNIGVNFVNKPAIINQEFENEVIAMENNIKEISSEEVEKILNTRKPLGLFYTIENNKYIAIDNLKGDAWTEEFNTLPECFGYLLNYYAESRDK